MAGAPASYTNLWATRRSLMPYDIVLLSCEGGETYNANPPALESYLNAGGRAFASHFHYAWFSGPLELAGRATRRRADWGIEPRDVDAADTETAARRRPSAGSSIRR